VSSATSAANDPIENLTIDSCLMGKQGSLPAAAVNSQADGTEGLKTTNLFLEAGERSKSSTRADELSPCVVVRKPDCGSVLRR
jgi:hypothetical protein